MNDLCDGLRAVGEHKSHLGHRRQGAGAGVEQDLADAVAGYGTAGLAEQDRFLASPGKPCPQALDLRGFARSVQAFESDKDAARHGLSLPPQLSLETTRLWLCYKWLNSSKYAGAGPLAVRAPLE